jgi:hypothetical protein
VIGISPALPDFQAVPFIPGDDKCLVGHPATSGRNRDFSHEQGKKLQKNGLWVNRDELGMLLSAGIAKAN